MSKMHHIVILRFKPGKEDAPPKLFAALAALKGTLPGILHFAAGPYSSQEGLNEGYTHGFLMTFKDAASRDIYLDHPEHVKVKNQFLPTIEKIVAFDFEDPS
jgi:hypothetical protein